MTYRRFQQMFSEGKVKKVLVIGPAGSELPWVDMFEHVSTGHIVLNGDNKDIINRDQFNYITSMFISYSMLTQKNDGKFSTKLFKDYTNFEPSTELIKMARKGLLLIIDESHLIKNESDRTFAVRSIIKTITGENDDKRNDN